MIGVTEPLAERAALVVERNAATARAERAEAELAAMAATLAELRAAAPVPIEPPAPPVDDLPACGSLHQIASATHRCALPPGHRGQCYAKHGHGTAVWNSPLDV